MTINYKRFSPGKSEAGYRRKHKAKQDLVFFRYVSAVIDQFKIIYLRNQ